MSFGEWKAYADASDTAFGGGLSLNIGREVAPHEWEMVQQIDTQGTEVKRVQEAEENSTRQPTIRIPLEVAEALYRALDRVFGQENTEGKVQALQEALDKERARVDLFITRNIGPTVSQQVPPRPMHQFAGPVPK